MRGDRSSRSPFAAASPSSSTARASCTQAISPLASSLSPPHLLLFPVQSPHIPPASLLLHSPLSQPPPLSLLPLPSSPLLSLPTRSDFPSTSPAGPLSLGIPALRRFDIFLGLRSHIPSFPLLRHSRPARTSPPSFPHPLHTLSLHTPLRCGSLLPPLFPFPSSSHPARTSPRSLFLSRSPLAPSSHLSSPH